MGDYYVHYGGHIVRGLENTFFSPADGDVFLNINRRGLLGAGAVTIKPPG